MFLHDLTNNAKVCPCKATQLCYCLLKQFLFIYQHAEVHVIQHMSLLNYPGIKFPHPYSEVIFNSQLVLSVHPWFTPSEDCVHWATNHERWFKGTVNAACALDGFVWNTCVSEIPQYLVCIESDGWLQWSSICPIWPCWGLLATTEETSSCLLIMSIHLPLYFGRHFLSLFTTFVGYSLPLFLSLFSKFQILVKHEHSLSDVGTLSLLVVHKCDTD